MKEDVKNLYTGQSLFVVPVHFADSTGFFGRIQHFRDYYSIIYSVLQNVCVNSQKNHKWTNIINYLQDLKKNKTKLIKNKYGNKITI